MYYFKSLVAFSRIYQGWKVSNSKNAFGLGSMKLISPSLYRETCFGAKELSLSLWPQAYDLLWPMGSQQEGWKMRLEMCKSY